MIAHLRSGKSPKEIAFVMKVTWSCVQQIIYRHRNARTTYIDTYPLRHPNRQGPPHRVIHPLRQVEL